MITVVTSCSAKGYAEYGQRFVETFDRHWPRDITLYVVSEDELVGLPKRTRFVPLYLSDKARHFEERHRDNLIGHGRQQAGGQNHWTPKKLQERYNFRYDAYRFAKKVFAIDLAAALTKTGRLYWIDADTITHATVSAKTIEGFLPSNAALSCLDRGQYHSECGFVGYNLDHAATRPFIDAFADTYASDRVFKLAEWHDSWVFDHLRRKMSVPAFHIPHQSRSHPLINSKLGCMFDHCKGARKETGRTPKTERIIKDGTAYWQ